MILAKRLVDRNFVWGLARRKGTKMKTIFRYANLGLLVAAMMAIGAVAGMAQDPCADPELTTLGDRVRAEFDDKSIAGRTKFLASGKQFQDKYGKCEPAQALNTWLTGQMPKTKVTLDALVEAEAKKKMIERFNAGLLAKNWDEVYASSKDLLQKYPDEFRDLEFVLGTIGYDELYNKNNSKYNDETVRFARQALANMESGKIYKAYGVPNDFLYKTKDNATGWMNLVIGYITQIGQKNKAGAAPSLYKATQAASETAKNPLPYELIGYFYFDELDKLTTEIKALADSQKPEDTPEVAQQKVDQIKAKVALANGTSERAIEAFAKANSLSTAKPYQAKMRTNIENAYKLRFAKGTEGMDAFIAEAAKKPFQNPMTPVTPISDPEPVKTDATSSTPTAPATTAPAKAGTPTTTTKPAGPIKPAPAKPGSGVKPQATVKKVAKKKVG